LTSVRLPGSVDPVISAGLFVGMAVGGGLGMYYGIGGAFALAYRLLGRDRAEQWKCQPRRYLSPELSRQQLLMGTFNMTAASVASGLLCDAVVNGGRTAIYLDWHERGLAYGLLATLVYFLVTDGVLYWAHRLLHRPALFRLIHRHHHRFLSPTAFTAAATHPAEFAFYQSLTLAPVLFLPMPAAGVIAVLVYHNCVALLDHSGIDVRTSLPWQPPPRFHDDHHVYFHVNYGQTLGIWDRMFGTHRREGRVYGIDVFGGKGKPRPGAREGEATPLVEYGKNRPPLTAADSEAGPLADGAAAERLDVAS
jgi:lathosterol oxidase